ncbi:MAG: GDSL-type esterase/lipase family protein [Fibrobacterota bacterium]|nr:GDSL-type esterase/lipase family protein [Chitinispirillaceae bacterium]
MKKCILILIICSVSIVLAQKKVACIGNSITFGYGLTNSTPTYPQQLQKLLGSGYTVENDGVSATTLLKKGNNPYWVNGKLSQAFAFKPDIVVIKLGTNDTKPENWNTHSGEFKSDYISMVDTIAKMPSKPKIYVVLPVPVFNNPVGASWGIRDSIIKLELPIIREVASERGLTVIDCYTPLLKFPQFFSTDGVHPNGAGADTIAHIVYRAITSTSSISVNSIPTARSQFQMQINPGLITISLPFSIYTINLFDISGKAVLHNAGTDGRAVLSSSAIANGMYQLRVVNGSNQVFQLPLMITQ